MDRYARSRPGAGALEFAATEFSDAARISSVRSHDDGVNVSGIGVFEYLLVNRIVGVAYRRRYVDVPFRREIGDGLDGHVSGRFVVGPDECQLLVDVNHV